jgi:hypothetical protein
MGQRWRGELACAQLASAGERRFGPAETHSTPRPARLGRLFEPRSPAPSRGSTTWSSTGSAPSSSRVSVSSARRSRRRRGWGAACGDGLQERGLAAAVNGEAEVRDDVLQFVAGEMGEEVALGRHPRRVRIRLSPGNWEPPRPLPDSPRWRRWCRASGQAAAVVDRLAMTSLRAAFARGDAGHELDVGRGSDAT